ncbi:hypothetical protein P170DRAFT_56336 [Aspergillus steynii IBT 23096]|uniref:Uncharacterized protein n=1 Tax=Aspergillus steynii IBT 23096 TaxID=1392250 RepID=A0A2I2FSH6_9EURO|nr:uncharacterized protein P170DRAFT_56336 [Aspergillus steynii IBT 23096]PLB43564.1 hypothetical protein P170DRAFT_56336 [Aspergillus steynii IBT 23096]
MLGAGLGHTGSLWLGVSYPHILFDFYFSFRRVYLVSFFILSYFIRCFLFPTLFLLLFGLGFDEHVLKKKKFYFPRLTFAYSPCEVFSFSYFPPDILSFSIRNGGFVLSQLVSSIFDIFRIPWWFPFLTVACNYCELYHSMLACSFPPNVLSIGFFLPYYS